MFQNTNSPSQFQNFCSQMQLSDMYVFTCYKTGKIC